MIEQGVLWARTGASNSDPHRPDDAGPGIRWRCWLKAGAGLGRRDGGAARSACGARDPPRCPTGCGTCKHGRRRLPAGGRPVRGNCLLLIRGRPVSASTRQLAHALRDPTAAVRRQQLRADFLDRFEALPRLQIIWLKQPLPALASCRPNLRRGAARLHRAAGAVCRAQCR